MGVSCIIPSYNSEHINSLLESISKNSVQPNEIIIVEDGSTYEVDTEKYNNKKIKNNHNEGPSKARNLGFKESNNEIILFLDSDTLITKNLIQRIINFFENNKHYHVWTTGYSTNTFSSNLINRYKSKYMNYIHKTVNNDVDFVLGACCAIRKDSFVPWNENLRYAEDTFWGHELVYKYKRKIYFDKINHIDHLKNYSFFSWMKNDFLIAEGMTYSLFIKKTNNEKLKFSHVSSRQLLSVFLSGLILLLLISRNYSLLLIMMIIWIIISFPKVRYISTKGSINLALVNILYFSNCIIHLTGIGYGLCKQLFSSIIKK